MSTTELRLAANRTNAAKSTGPVSADGKVAVSRNAMRHGILSSRLLLDDEAPEEFETLVEELSRSLQPVGMIEEALVDRIAVTIWRQRRLVSAEAASIALTREPKKIAVGVSNERGRGYGSEVTPDEFRQFDAERSSWCQSTLAEIEAMDTVDLECLVERAPLVHQQLQSDASDNQSSVESYIQQHKGGLTAYLAELTLWCREQLREAKARPQILALAEQVRQARLVLSGDALDVFARYQTTLDNQLYKSLRALREAQEWRLRTLDAKPAIDASGVSTEVA